MDEGVIIPLLRERIRQAAEIAAARLSPIWTAYLFECGSHIDFDEWVEDNFDADYKRKPPSKDWAAELSPLSELLRG